MKGRRNRVGVSTIWGARSALALTITGSLIIASCGSGSSEATPITEPAQVELTPVAVQMHFLPEPSWGTHLYGIEHGIFEAHGIELELIPGQGSNFTMQQLNENRVQFGQASLIAYLASRAEVGSETMAVFSAIDHPQAGILSTTPAETLEDLMGATVGMIAFSVGRGLLPIVLAENGLPPDSIQIEVVTYSYGLLLEGVVDGIEVYKGGNMATAIRIAEEAGVDVYHIDLADYGLEGYAHSLIVRSELIENDPDLVGRMVSAMAESVEAAVAASPEEIAELVTARAPEYSTEVVLAEWADYLELINEGFTIDADVVATNLGYVSDALRIPHDLQLNEVFTNEFIPTG